MLISTTAIDFGPSSYIFILSVEIMNHDLKLLPPQISNAGHLGVSYAQNLRPGVKVTLSSLIDAKNFNAGGHKLGLGLEFSH